MIIDIYLCERIDIIIAWHCKYLPDWVSFVMSISVSEPDRGTCLIAHFGAPFGGKEEDSSPSFLSFFATSPGVSFVVLSTRLSSTSMNLFSSTIMLTMMNLLSIPYIQYHLLSDLHWSLCMMSELGSSGLSDSSVMYAGDMALQNFISLSVTTAPRLSNI